MAINSSSASAPHGIRTCVGARSNALTLGAERGADMGTAPRCVWEKSSGEFCARCAADFNRLEKVAQHLSAPYIGVWVITISLLLDWCHC
jgi:hypothetical protein